MSIHILDDDSLLNIFDLYRPAIFVDDGVEHVYGRIFGVHVWDHERWWYKIAQVCQRWRSLVLGSAYHLRLSLLCTWRTPASVADMLAHSPPLPLVIDFFTKSHDITVEDEDRIILALEQRDHVRRVRLRMPGPKLQKLITTINEEYPVLESLVVGLPLDAESTALMLPETFQAPHLRHLLLEDFAIPLGCRLLTTAVGLVTLFLTIDPRSPATYFQPNILLYWLSFMAQLETLHIALVSPVRSRDVERQLMHTPIITHVTLPNLRWFGFKGASAYVEAVVRRITTPRLEKLDFQFFKQLTFSVPHLLGMAESLRFESVELKFQIGYGFYLRVYPSENLKAEMFSLQMSVLCWHFDWQVSSVAQIFNALRQKCSTVEHLTLEHTVYHNLSSEEHNDIDRTEWRKLLGSFSNVKTLHVGDGLVEELSGSLRLGDGELPLELLPELQELRYSGSGETGDTFTSFIDARQNAGRPVTLVQIPRSVTPSRSSRPGP